MCEKELELLELLISDYGNQKLKAITGFIRHMDTPMSVRNLELGVVACNNAFLDMLRRTREQHMVASIVSSYSPADIVDGYAAEWLQKIKGAMNRGSGSVLLRVWDGGQVIPVTTSVLRVDSWVLGAFEINPRAMLRSVRPG